MQTAMLPCRLVSRRGFSGTPASLTQEIIREKQEAISEARKWLQQNSRKYKYAEGSGRNNFVGRDGKPFPMNKYFTHNPTTETPLKLANDYSLSIARVNAILRLKAFERKQIKEGDDIQVHLSRGMERLLGSSDSKRRLKEKPYVLTAERLKPLFQLVDEEAYMTPEDAAELLDLEPYANREIRLNVQAERMALMAEASDDHHAGWGVRRRRLSCLMMCRMLLNLCYS
ncbi:hypothetical protein BC829DRAFT_490168 [Chytridium lagenaria]|nr:hypothetical protein BC829DRAFT_490168 [Chytridium lagenaria]